MSDTFADRLMSSMGVSDRTRAWSPSTMIDAWDDFVNQCEDGYIGAIYEYSNDLSVRDALEKGLDWARGQADSDARDFENSVNVVDRRFMELIDEGPEVDSRKPWWRSRLPPRAGDEFAADVLSRYSVKIESGG